MVLLSCHSVRSSKNISKNLQKYFELETREVLLVRRIGFADTSTCARNRRSKMKTSKFGKIFAILVVLIGTLTEHTVPVYAAEEEKTTDGSLSTMSKQFLEIHQDDFDMER